MSEKSSSLTVNCYVVTAARRNYKILAAWPRDVDGRIEAIKSATTLCDQTGFMYSVYEARHGLSSNGEGSYDLGDFVLYVEPKPLEDMKFYTLSGALGEESIPEYLFTDKALAEKSARLYNLALNAHKDKTHERLSATEIKITGKVPWPDRR